MVMASKVKKKAPEPVSSLDILEVLKKNIYISENWAVDSVDVHLEMTAGESYVEVHYYDITIIPLNIYAEELTHSKVSLSQDETNKMYSDIRQLVNLPAYVHTLHTHLPSNSLLPSFDVTLTPSFK
jgi:hypothetical protein